MKLNEKISDKKIFSLRFLIITFSFSLLIMYLEPIVTILNIIFYNPLINRMETYYLIRFIFIGISIAVFIELGVIIFKIRWFENELHVTKSNCSFPNFMKGYVFSICAYLIKMDSTMGTNYHLQILFPEIYPSGNFSLNLTISLAVIQFFLLFETYYTYTAWKKLKNILLSSPNQRLTLHVQKSTNAIRIIQIAVLFFSVAYVFPLIGYLVDVFYPALLGFSIVTTVLNNIGITVLVNSEVIIIRGYFLLGINIKKKTKNTK